ncbi:NAD-dependent epimerase/dehydratase family protein, partial [bacterium]|nr:NAD-dependent epimerase/dehydratase family protein [bacterium]
MKCLVTGSAGFIGSALIKRLTNEGYKVRGLVHLEQPRHPIKNVEYIQGDIADKESIRSAVEGADVVFHCAALVK